MVGIVEHLRMFWMTTLKFFGELILIAIEQFVYWLIRNPV